MGHVLRACSQHSLAFRLRPSINSASRTQSIHHQLFLVAGAANWKGPARAYDNAQVPSEARAAYPKGVFTRIRSLPKTTNEKDARWRRIAINVLQ
jgi:hypothetical protein